MYDVLLAWKRKRSFVHPFDPHLASGPGRSGVGSGLLPHPVPPPVGPPV